MAFKKTRLQLMTESSTHPKMTEWQGVLGKFDLLPLEILHTIMDNLSVQDLSILTITSKAMRDVVCNTYISQQGVFWKFIPSTCIHLPVPSYVQKSYLESFRNLGILVKRSTCLFPTKCRLKIIGKIFSLMPCSIQGRCNDLNRCITLTCCGHLLHTFVAGWEMCELDTVCVFIEQHSTWSKSLNRVLTCKPGQQKKLEIAVRNFYRKVLLDTCPGNREKQQWMTHFLGAFSSVARARVMFILYGPMREGEILWYDTMHSVPATFDQVQEYFEELGHAFQLLDASSFCKKYDLFNVIETITETPGDWLPENIAALLIMCGEQVTTKLLHYKIESQQTRELALLFTSFSVLYSKYDMQFEWTMNTLSTVYKALSKPEKTRLTDFIVESFQESIQDLHESTISGNEGDEDNLETSPFIIMLKAQACFYKSLMNRYFSS